jgi:hypothetical protein
LFYDEEAPTYTAAYFHLGSLHDDGLGLLGLEVFKHIIRGCCRTNDAM